MIFLTGKLERLFPSLQFSFDVCWIYLLLWNIDKNVFNSLIALSVYYNNNNNNDRLTAFDPGQPG